MVLNATNDDRRRFEILAGTGEVDMALLAERRVLEKELAVFRGGCQVRVELRKRLRHWQ